MEIDFTMDYNDDEHFCLKCKSTISGLDNYVQHRKRKCQDLVGILVSLLVQIQVAIITISNILFYIIYVSYKTAS